MNVTQAKLFYIKNNYFWTCYNADIIKRISSFNYIIQNRNTSMLRAKHCYNRRRTLDTSEKKK